LAKNADNEDVANYPLGWTSSLPERANYRFSKTWAARLVVVMLMRLMMLGFGQSCPAQDLGRVIKGKAPPASNADILQGKVNTSVKTTAPWSNLGFAYTLDNSKTFSLNVTQVLPQSPAYKAGLQPGDKILDVNVSPAGTSLQVQRQGKIYVASIKAPESLLNGLKADERLGRLAAHKLVILIDQSGSMYEKDCPGNLTRWDWCREETMKVGKALTDRFGKDITVATFSNWYRLYPHCSISDIQHIFLSNEPAGDTQPQFPMKEVFSDYFKHTQTDPRPLMVAVVTDGVPTQPLDVAETIMEATKQMNYPAQVKVTFLQIADDPRAQSLLSAFDSDLQRDGARYDIVDYVEFKDVIKRGLLQSLIDSANGQLASSVANRPYTGNLHRYENGLQGLQGLPVYANPHNVSQERTNIENRILDKYKNK